MIQIKLACVIIGALSFGFWHKDIAAGVFCAAGLYLLSGV
jgi:hypothetical protein